MPGMAKRGLAKRGQAMHSTAQFLTNHSKRGVAYLCAVRPGKAWHSKTQFFNQEKMKWS